MGGGWVGGVGGGSARSRACERAPGGVATRLGPAAKVISFRANTHVRFQNARRCPVPPLPSCLPPPIRWSWGATIASRGVVGEGGRGRGGRTHRFEVAPVCAPVPLPRLAFFRVPLSPPTRTHALTFRGQSLAVLNIGIDLAAVGGVVGVHGCARRWGGRGRGGGFSFRRIKVWTRRVAFSLAPASR